MPHIPLIQSRTNRPSGGGPKKAGMPDHTDYPSIPHKIFMRKTPKSYLFDSATGKASMTQTTSTN